MPGTEHDLPKGPTHGALVLFTAAIIATIVLVIAGTAAAIYTAVHHTDATRQQLQSVISQQQAVITREEKELRSSCGFWYALSGLPITAVPGAKPSKLGVSIITGSRASFMGQDCGTLPPASPSVRQWAAYYHLPVP